MYFVFVLMGWSLLPNVLRPFKIYCAPPNLGIRTWICQLNLLRGPFFQAWGSLMSLKSQTRDPSLKSLPEDLCSGFLRPEKIHRPQSGLNPRTLDLEAITLPRDYRGRQYPIYFNNFKEFAFDICCKILFWSFPVLCLVYMHRASFLINHMKWENTPAVLWCVWAHGRCFHCIVPIKVSVVLQAVKRIPEN